MQSSLYSQILLYLEDPAIVMSLVVIVLIIRILWRTYRRRHPLTVPVVRTTSRRNKAAAVAEAAKAAKPPKDYTLEVIDTLLIALVLVFGIVRPFMLQTFFIPSRSMEPTLLVKDKLIANKFIFNFRPPQRGEVIVFQPPVDAVEGSDAGRMLRRWLQEYPDRLTAPESFLIAQAVLPEVVAQNPKLISQTDRQQNIKFLEEYLPTVPKRRDDYIKRVIGIPGDTIRIVKGEGVYVNRNLIKESYLPGDNTTYPRAPMNFPNTREYKIKPESPPTLATYLADVRVPENANAAQVSEVAQLEKGQLENYIQHFYMYLDDWYKLHRLYKDRLEANIDGAEFRVPPNTVFVLGDNRETNGSFDSRYWGVVPYSSIRARAISTFWPLNRLKLL